MTKKQFTWLKDNQPFEAIRIWAYGCHKDKCPICTIKSIMFDGEYIRVNGIQHHFNGRNLDEFPVSFKIHRRYVKSILYSKKEYNINRYNTEGNTR